MTCFVGCKTLTQSSPHLVIFVLEQLAQVFRGWMPFLQLVMTYSEMTVSDILWNAIGKSYVFFQVATLPVSDLE